MAQRVQPDVRQLLAQVLDSMYPAPNQEPWTEGWAYDDYRQSPDAAFAGPDGPLTMTEDGCRAFEDAIEALLHERDVKRRWAEKDLWSAVADLLAYLYGVADRESGLDRGLKRVRGAKAALVILPVANVIWTGVPELIGDLAIGVAGDQFVRLVNELEPSDARADPILQEYVDECASRESPVVLLACRTEAQGSWAIDQATQRLRAVLDLAILLGVRLSEYRWTARRSQVNRPGVRGLAIDRPAVEKHLSEAGRLEFAAQPLVISSTMRSRRAVHWYSADPMQLDLLLRNNTLRGSLTRCVTNTGPVCSRLRVAARWFAEAHWAEDDDDAALALGVAMDALVGSKGALPGRSMAERYALLADEPYARQERADRYKRIHAVRSSIAHGGRSGELEKPDYILSVQMDVEWAASRLIALDDFFHPKTEAEFDGVFDELRWGTAFWPPP